MGRKKRAKTGAKTSAARTLAPKGARSVTGGLASHTSGPTSYNKKNVTTIKAP